MVRFMPRTMLALVCVTFGWECQVAIVVSSEIKDAWETFAVAKGGEPILLPVEIDGEKFQFLLDSGTTHYVFDVSLRKHLGRSVGSATARGGGQSGIRLEEFTTPPFCVGALQVSPPPGGTSPVADFAGIRKVLEWDVRGLLGVPFFQGRLVQFDWL